MKINKIIQAIIYHLQFLKRTGIDSIYLQDGRLENLYKTYKNNNLNWPNNIELNLKKENYDNEADLISDFINNNMSLETKIDRLAYLKNRMINSSVGKK